MGLKIRKGDTVQVIAGKDKNAKGKVILVDTERERVLVEGVSQIKRHTKVSTSQRGAKQGGIVTQEAPVHVSNVQVVCPSCNKPTRVGRRKDDTGKNVRFCKRCDTDI
ncbi:MAG: large subunit ribosomal protein [Frankiales bacterium]|jgi:large subunit ribosomal protein L24|nr:large subunit ribosomal protein [Frankiales bacterium]